MKPAEREKLKETCRRIFADLTVRHGPFKGMRYPSFQSVGSAIFPKLLGSYESELQDLIFDLINRGYDSIVDVGCAEGYYAVGFGMRLEGVRILAFDQNVQARELCREMGELNGVEIEIGRFCDKASLMDLELGRKALILSDCEGYENLLFDREVAVRLAAHDFLIETHDFLDIETTRRLLEIFSETHRCRTLQSVDDIIKAYTYQFEELEPFSLMERRRIVGEFRPAIMRWIFAESH